MRDYPALHLDTTLLLLICISQSQ